MSEGFEAFQVRGQPVYSCKYFTYRYSRSAAMKQLSM